MSRLTSTMTMLALVIAAGAAGCGGTDGGSSAPPPSTALVETPVGELVQADAERADAAEAEQGEAAIAANNAFGLSLLGELTSAEGNLFLSPISIQQALTMVYAGARGETAEQMADALELTELAPDSIHEAMNALDRSLPRSSSDEGQARTFRLAVANALWVEATYGVEAPFLETLARSYGAGLTGLDFIGAPDSSRKRINAWAERETQGRIEELLPEGAVNDLTRLVITNAIHFDAAWEQRFHPAGKASFQLPDGSTQPVEMMTRRAPAGIGAGDGYKACELTYRGGEYSMLLIVPDEGRYEEIEDELSPEFLESALGELSEERDVALDMPRLKFRTEFALEEPLRSLGMSDAFDEEAADLTGINRNARDEGLHISDVFHDAFVRVDEKGTEAAAATGIPAQLVSLPPNSLTVDRPFLFAIRARDTGAILFLGRFVAPE